MFQVHSNLPLSIIKYGVWLSGVQSLPIGLLVWIRDRFVPLICPVCKVFSNLRDITRTISIYIFFNNTGLMELAPTALSGLRFDKSSNTPLGSILITGIVGHLEIFYKHIVYVLDTQLP